MVVLEKVKYVANRERGWTDSLGSVEANYYKWNGWTIVSYCIVQVIIFNVLG